VLWKLPLSGHRTHGLSYCRIGPVAIDPTETSAAPDGNVDVPSHQGFGGSLEPKGARAHATS
jgi:hypothetical protein